MADLRSPGRRRVLARLAAAVGAAALPPAPARASAPAPASDPWSSYLEPDDEAAISIDLPQLRYSGRWEPRQGAMRVLARELRLRTRLEPIAEPTSVEAESAALFATPFLYVAGEGGLPPLSRAAEGALRRFLDFGGFIVFDAADGGTDDRFADDVETLLGRIAPGSSLSPVASDHVLFRSFYLIEAPYGRTATFADLVGVQDEGRLRAVLVRNDLGGALAETTDGLPAHPCIPGGADQRQWAIRFAVNLLLYATCTDYKADRAHVETLLRSRRWK